MTHEFAHKVVIVTGGSRGIGAEIVRAFASQGATVHFTYLSSQQEATQMEGAFPGLVRGFCVDGRDQDQVKAFVKSVGKEHGRIDILVNNAGVVVRSLLASLSLEDWEKSFQSNLRAPFLFCTAALRYLMKSESASIVNISSVTANRVTRGLGAYCATKAGLESISQVLALEYAPYNIRVNTVAPGLIATDMSADTSEEWREKILARTPLKRMGEPCEVAAAVLFLASPQASYITGSQLFVTGGRHLE